MNLLAELRKLPYNLYTSSNTQLQQKQIWWGDTTQKNVLYFIIKCNIWLSSFSTFYCVSLTNFTREHKMKTLLLPAFTSFIAFTDLLRGVFATTTCLETASQSRAQPCLRSPSIQLFQPISKSLRILRCIMAIIYLSSRETKLLHEN